MSKDFLLNEYVLPPNVSGKPRGVFEITLAEIKWTTAAFNGAWSSSEYKKHFKTPDNFIGSGGVSVKFIWWGQNHQDGAILKISGHSGKLEKKFVRYRINTSHRLFKNYLCNCEPIEIKLTANTSNLQLGTIFAKIPSEIVNGCKADAGYTFYVNKFQIFSPKNIQIGYLQIKFEMLFYEDLLSARSSDYSFGSFKNGINFNKDEHLIDLPITARSYKSFKAESLLSDKCSRPKSAQLTDKMKQISPKILDYLSGIDMSSNEEKKALEEIRRTSPLNSVDDLISDRFKEKKEILYGKIDSLRLIVKHLILLPSEIKEVYIQALPNVGFTIECRISPNLLDEVRPKLDYDVMRFYSDAYSNQAHEINFNKDAIRAIKIIQNKQNPMIVEEGYLLFTIWWRQFGCKHSRCLGTAKFEFTSLFEAAELEQTQKLPIKSCASNIHVADLICKITLGTKGVHFKQNSKACCDSNKKCLSSNEMDLKTSISRNCNTDNDVENTKNSSSSSASGFSKTSPIRTDRSDQATQTVLSKSPKDEEKINITKKKQHLKNENYRLLHGLLYAGSLRNVKPIEGEGGYFLVCRAFWKEDASSTEFAQENSFNFLEIFPIINDQKFLDRTRNNHLVLEIWQKTTNNPEQLLGMIRLPLHQFFIAFRDSTITNHLCQGKLPVISIDGWVAITSPLSGEICGQIQTLLAIGTEEQLEYLKATRGLSFNQVYKNPVPDLSAIHIPVPQISKSHVNLNEDKSSNETQSDSSENRVNSRRERLSDLLGNFIENLAQKLPPERPPQDKSNNMDINSMPHQNFQPGIQIRKTSDLLDVLQKALVTPPAYDMSSRRSNSDSAIISNTFGGLRNNQGMKCFKILLEIESALHLPRNQSKVFSKKSSKRSNSNKIKQFRLPPDEEPSAYVTFQAEEGYGQMIKSHEGMVYATHVVEKTCNPSWTKRFEIAVPSDLLANDEKRFILKIWRKATTDLAQCRLLPTPMEDSIIGFAAIDLNVLLARMPFISGWFNIVDFNGRINGQIKVNVQPLEDVMKFKENTTLRCIPPHSSHESNEQGTSGIDLNNTTLSRAIKRKFTELEEITQRLRARLFDVTGEAGNEITTEIVEPVDIQLDEFERDINTAAVEDEDDDINGRKNFGWLGCVPSNVDTLHSECSSNSISDTHERIQMISEYLRRTDLSESNTINYIIEEERNSPDGGTESRCTKNN